MFGRVLERNDEQQQQSRKSTLLERDPLGKIKGNEQKIGLFTKIQEAVVRQSSCPH